MLTKIEFAIQDDEKIKFSNNKASLFQGVLMEYLDFDYGEKMHLSELKPYSQHLEFKEGKWVWVISTLSLESKENIIDKISNVKKIRINYDDIDVFIEKTNIYQISYDQLLQQTFFAECNRYITIKFVTPTAFKSDGRYIFYPSARHIFQSLINKFDAGASSMEIYTPQLLDDIDDMTMVTRYNLKSTMFFLEGTKIPSFVGEITLKINGPQQLVNLVHLLLMFGEYSGIGIKTAIGMGAIKIIEREKKNAGKTV